MTEKSPMRRYNTMITYHRKAEMTDSVLARSEEDAKEMAEVLFKEAYNPEHIILEITAKPVGV